MMDVLKYYTKLMDHGLVDRDADIGLYGLDDEIYTNQNQIPAVVREVFELLTINSLLIARPNQLQWAIISDLIRTAPQGLICPRDCESLTFIHDIPVISGMEAHKLAQALNRRKGCIVEDVGIVTTGTVTLEQTFVSFSSICFATFVKYFTDILNGVTGFGPHPDPYSLHVLDSIFEACCPHSAVNPLPHSTPKGEEAIITAMDQAGKAVVTQRLVDSFFGNISFRNKDVLYISQTGSSLDELPGHIDCVPQDGSSTCELTSSSELLAHVRIYERTGDIAILHGHPRFSVIGSMHGSPMGFEEQRCLGDIPIVAGEVGAGKHGLVHTLPPAMERMHAAIVYGHGTFCSSPVSFSAAFETLAMIEQLSFLRYRELIQRHG